MLYGYTNPNRQNDHNNTTHYIQSITISTTTKKDTIPTLADLTVTGNATLTVGGPSGLTFKDNELYMLDFDALRVYKISHTADTTMSNDNRAFTIPGDSANPQGITWNGTQWVTVDRDDRKFYVYNANGTAASIPSHALNSANSNPKGVTFLNNKYYVVDSTQDSVYVYDDSFDYTNTSFRTTGGFPTGITNDGTLSLYC